MTTALALEESLLVETVREFIHHAIRQERYFGTPGTPSQPRHLDDRLRSLRQTILAAREVVRR